MTSYRGRNIYHKSPWRNTVMFKAVTVTKRQVAKVLLSNLPVSYEQPAIEKDTAYLSELTLPSPPHSFTPPPSSLPRLKGCTLFPISQDFSHILSCKQLQCVRDSENTAPPICTKRQFPLRRIVCFVMARTIGKPFSPRQTLVP